MTTYFRMSLPWQKSVACRMVALFGNQERAGKARDDLSRFLREEEEYAKDFLTSLGRYAVPEGVRFDSQETALEYVAGLKKLAAKHGREDRIWFKIDRIVREGKTVCLLEWYSRPVLTGILTPEAEREIEKTGLRPLPPYTVKVVGKLLEVELRNTVSTEGS